MLLALTIAGCVFLFLMALCICAEQPEGAVVMICISLACFLIAGGLKILCIMPPVVLLWFAGVAWIIFILYVMLCIIAAMN